MRISGIAALSVALALIASPGIAEADHVTAKCRVDGRPIPFAKARARSALIYTYRAPSSGSSAWRYFACWVRTGRTVLLGRTTPGRSFNEFQGFSVRGEWLFWAKIPVAPQPAGSKESVFTANIRTGARGIDAEVPSDLTGLSYGPVRFYDNHFHGVLLGNGSVAWVNNQALQPPATPVSDIVMAIDRSGIRELDRGAAGSVSRLSAGVAVVSWTINGMRKHARL